MKEHIAIIGAGLTGLACAIHLAQRGFKISVYEYRSQQEIEAMDLKPSITLGRAMSMDLSARGIYALDHIGVLPQVIAHAVSMKHKIFHDITGKLIALPLGPTSDHFIWAVSRRHLFDVLLQRIKQFKNITTHFLTKFLAIDFSSLTVTLQDLNQNRNFTIKPNILIGADGSNSSVRRAFESYIRVPFTTRLMPQSYIELSIPTALGKALEQHAMHFWSRDRLMLVAQPNRDHSFTCALLMPENGALHSFETIRTAEEIEHFFQAFFCDAYPLIPHLSKQYTTNSVNHLRIVQGQTWTCHGNFLLIGDAAHGTVPFFGQGVNCCFEDCTVLEQILNETNEHWTTALNLFEERRVKNGNAMSTMSFCNYPELLYSNVIERVLLKKQIELEISQKYASQYITYHNLVCFSRVPYVFAMKCKTLQEAMLERLIEGITCIDQLNWQKVDAEIAHYIKELAHTVN